MADYPLPVADLTLEVAAAGDMRYFVVFSSRDYTPVVAETLGHAFVSWGMYDPISATCNYESYGLYNVDTPFNALAAAAGFIGPVPGEVQDESLNSFQSVGSIVDSLVVETGLGPFLLSHYDRNKMSEEPQPYMLGSNDCVTFVQKMAEDVGLNPPPRELLTNMPLRYIQELKKSAMAVQHTPTFTGPMVGDLPAGFGTKTFPDGSSWVGNMYGFSMSGTGIYTRPDGTVIHGQFALDHSLSGNCKIDYPDGSSFSGSLNEAGIPNGNCAYKYPNGNGFAGNVVNGKPISGRYTFSDGSSIGGTIVDGHIQGVGFMSWANGAHYQGSIVGDQPNGMGTYYYPDGSHVTGNFVNGNIPNEPRSPNVIPVAPVGPPGNGPDPAEPNPVGRINWGG